MNKLTQLKEKFLTASKSSPVILDGAVGSALINRLGQPRSKVWASEFNETHPEEVIRLHRDYLSSGSDIITTNTFRTNPAMREQAANNALTESKIRTAVLLAREAVANTGAFIAGSNAPAEDCYQIERTLTEVQLSQNHHFHISKLFEYGVDFILNETQGHLDEIVITSEYCSKMNIPFAVSLFCNSNLRLLSGEHISEALSIMSNYNPLFISFNCITFKTMSEIIESVKLPEVWGCYLNCGTGNITDPVIHCGISPEEYVSLMRNIVAMKPAVIGACCGSDPSHISNLRRSVENHH